MRRHPLLRATPAVALCAALTLAGSPAFAGSPALAAPPALAVARRTPPPTAAEQAAAAADQFVASPSAAPALYLGADDRLLRTAVLAGTRGLHYVTYDRTYRGLAVIGGDVVVTADEAGSVRGTAVAQHARIDVGVTPVVTAAAAERTASAQLTTVDDSTAARLVVLARSATPRLAWLTTVTGRGRKSGPSVLHVEVDALTGTVLEAADDVHAGAGTGYYYGPVTIDTSGSYAMAETARPGLQCGGQDGAAYAGTDDVWGTGAGTDLETACVDALYGAEHEVDLLADWYGRDGIEGDGVNPPIRVGLDDVNAYWTGAYVTFGHNSAGDRQATPIDVVAHELGHAIFQYTPGGAGEGDENNGLNEGSSDIWGALTEAYTNSPLDPPDYTVGEEVDLTGDGPIRYMYDPSLAGDPNCWSTAIPSTEAHAAAGPLNHWFYLVAAGSHPAGGPASPTCDGTAETGIGIRTAGEIYYNALLAKTSTWRYADARTATLAAAKNLFPGSCTEFDAVRDAWSAVDVPVQTGEPRCNLTGNDFALAATPATGTVPAGATISTSIGTTVTAGAAQPVALTVGGLPSGVTATLTPASVTAGSASILSFTVSAATAGGSYPITVTGTGDDQHSTAYTLVVTGLPGCRAGNGTDLAIPDGGPAVLSPITITGCGRTCSAGAQVEVHIKHPYRGDLVILLVSPDGSYYRLKSSDIGDSAPDVNETYSVDLSAEPADGTWNLRVQDVYAIDAGLLDTWTLSL